MKKYFVGFAVVVAISALFFAKYTGEDTFSSSERTPAETSTKIVGTEELFSGAKKVLADLNNPNVFNSRTCADVVNGITDYLFYLPANHFIPKNEVEKEYLKSNGPELLNTIFQIRLTLHEKLKQFDSEKDLETKCITEIREGFQYARFTEEYVLDWLYAQKVYTFKKTPILIDEQPSTWTNPKFKGFQLQSGDVMLVRGKSYVSAMIARIADEEGNFSHAALVAEDKAGNKYVVESLIQHGVVVTPLEKWRQAEDSRVMLFRYPDQALAKKAARYMYDLAQGALDRKQGIRYDFAMNDDDYSSMFCSEVIRVAYDKASGGKLIIPKYRSTTTKFKDQKYPRTLGVTKTSLFAPYDIEVDPRFDLVAEYRFMPLLRQVRMQDAVLQSVYGWMTNKGYDFHWDLGHSSKSYLAKMARQFGIAKDTLPKYMPVATIKTTVQFETVAAALEKNIYQKEGEYYQTHGYLPSFQDMLAFNEAFRIKDCKAGKRLELPGLDRSEFHGFFYSDSKNCE